MKWKNEIYQHEVTPPDGVWNRIVHDLDNEFIVFKNTFHNLEINPPGSSWDIIQNTLNTPQDTKISSITIKKVIRIAVAAAIIGISFFTANYFITDIKPNTTTGQKVQPGTQNDNLISSPDTKNTEKLQTTVSHNSTPVIASITGSPKNTTPQNSTPSGMYSNDQTLNTPAISSIQLDEIPISDRYNLDNTASKRIRNLKGEIKEDVRLLDLPNSYFYMTGPNGQSIRVSSKFRNTIQYLNGSEKEEMLDVILRESRYWRNQFKIWKEEVGTSTFIPSANNFMDISELMKLLSQHNDK